MMLFSNLTLWEVSIDICHVTWVDWAHGENVWVELTSHISSWINKRPVPRDGSTVSSSSSTGSRNPLKTNKCWKPRQMSPEIQPKPRSFISSHAKRTILFFFDKAILKRLLVPPLFLPESGDVVAVAVLGLVGLEHVVRDARVVAVQLVRLVPRRAVRNPTEVLVEVILPTQPSHHAWPTPV